MKTSFRSLAAVAAAASLLVLGTGCSAASVAGSALDAATKAANPTTAPKAVPSPGPLRQVASTGAVAADEALAPGQCHARTVDAAAGKYLPDPSCTPGALNPAVTQANIDSTICKSGYTATVRPPASATEKAKEASLKAYGEPSAKTTEYDHLVSLELGGAPASALNLWPEPNKSGATGTTNPKDAVENALHTAVCTHKVTLAAAQAAIAYDWTNALHSLGL